MVDTGRLTLPEIAESQSSKYVTHNESLWRLDCFVQAVIKDRDLTSPPGAPNEGDCYIPKADATGAWDTYSGKVAQYQNSAWVFLTPFEGMTVFVEDEDLFLVYHSGWRYHPASMLDIGSFYPGSPGNSEVIFRLPMARSVRFPASMLDSQGKAGTAATGQTDFDLQKNGGSFGTMRFGAAATVATFIAATATDFAPGDVLTIVGPNPADATLADFGFILAGYKTKPYLPSSSSSSCSSSSSSCSSSSSSSSST
jgi:hypothetical protein